MRLTLRTLLAYRDHVLSPSELEDLHKRVQQSEMAGKLLRRMDALSNRPRLLAPRVDGRGLGGDANTVAEYLDDTLQSDRVPELERICLESDIQLAELAHCHKMLASVLHHSDEIPQELFQRVVDLKDPARLASRKPSKSVGQNEASAFDSSANFDRWRTTEDGLLKRIDQPHEAVFSAQHVHIHKSVANSPGDLVGATAVAKPKSVQSPMVASGGQSIRPSGLDLEGGQLAHEVPEYLRGRTKDGWRGLLVIGLLLVTLGFVAWQAIGPWEGIKQLLANRPSDRNAGTVNSGEVDSQSDSGESSKSTETLPQEPEKEFDSRSSTVDRVVDSNTKASNSFPVEPVESSPRVPNNQGDLQHPTNPADLQPDKPTAVKEKNSTVKPDGASDSHQAAPVLIWSPTVEREKRAVLFVTSADGTQIKRLTVGDAIERGMGLVVPPATQATVDIAGQMRWTFCGPTKMKVDRENADVAPVVRLEMARALIASGSNGRSIQLSTADWLGIVSLDNVANKAAIELNYRTLVHGTLTDGRTMVPVLTIVAIEGSLQVQPIPGVQAEANKDRNPIKVEVGEGLAIVRGNPPEKFKLKQVLPWYRSITDRLIDIQAAEDLGRLVPAGSEAVQALGEASKSRRPETCAVATQALCMLGQWSSLVRADGLLSSSSGRSHWSHTLDLTRQLLSADQQQVARLRENSASVNLDHGNSMVDLILGQTTEQLDQDGLEPLVKLLESELLSERVLAIYQLKKLTGQDFAYQASSPSRSSLMQWRRELVSKRLRIVSPAGLLVEAAN